MSAHGESAKPVPLAPTAPVARSAAPIAPAARPAVDHATRAAVVEVKADPGHGFAQAASTCARARSRTPAHDPNGDPTAGTITVNVHFER